MGKILLFKKNSAGGLNEFLDRAVLLRRKIDNIQNGILTDVKAIEKLFEGQIAGVLIDNRLISEGFFLCGIYIAGILRDFIYFCPASWYAVDYLQAAAEKDNPLFLKNGADICFIVCSLFEGRTNRARRATNKKTYMQIGGMLYYQYFSKTGNDIGLLMSDNFETMAGVTNEAVAKMKGG